jgi:hypothetical protein
LARISAEERSIDISSSSLFLQLGSHTVVAAFSSDPKAQEVSAIAWVDGENFFNDLGELNWWYEDGLVPLQNNADDMVRIGNEPNPQVIDWIPGGGPYTGSIDNIRILPLAVSEADALLLPDTLPSHPADVNGDGIVNFGDFALNSAITRRAKELRRSS